MFYYYFVHRRTQEYIYVIGLIIDFKVTFELAAIRMVFLFFFWPHKQVLGG